MKSLDRETRLSIVRPGALLAIAFAVALWAAAEPAWAQDRYDDHELTDRFYIRLGGFKQTQMRTTIRLDAKTPAGGIALGAVIALESQFDLDDQVSTGRLDGWYRFNRRHRINWSLWESDREGVRTYNGTDDITIGDDVLIAPGDSVATREKSQFMAAGWSYSFVNNNKYEAWLGVGLNFQRVDTSIIVSAGGGTMTEEASAKGTVPIPTLNFGGRWDFNKRWRMLVTQDLFGIRIGNYEGRLNNTRVLA